MTKGFRVSTRFARTQDSALLSRLLSWAHQRPRDVGSLTIHDRHGSNQYGARDSPPSSTLRLE